MRVDNKSSDEPRPDAITPDAITIDTFDHATLLRWSYRLVVTPLELKQAIARVGSSVARIRAYFGLTDLEVWPFAEPRGA
jgi:Protein of unknown function (DUF3606).